jgi:hypothetical protein
VGVVLLIIWHISVRAIWHTIVVVVPPLAQQRVLNPEVHQKWTLPRNSVSCLALKRQIISSKVRRLISKATPLHDAVFNKFFTGLSGNPVGTSAIVLRQDKLTTPELWAIAISHELVHVQHGDPTSALSHHTLLHHLWITEEEKRIYAV